MKLNTISPSLAVEDAEKAMAFYEKVFGAEEVDRYQRPDGFIDHAEIKIGDSILMISGHDPQYNANPKGQEQASVMIHLMVEEDVDGVFERAVENGAEIRIPVSEQFYGHRCGRFQDPFGHIWLVAQDVAKMSREEMRAAYQKMFTGGEQS